MSQSQNNFQIPAREEMTFKVLTQNGSQVDLKIQRGTCLTLALKEVARHAGYDCEVTLTKQTN